MYNNLEIFNLEYPERRRMVIEDLTPHDVRTKFLNMTQKELAERLGITDKAVSNKENGRRRWQAKEIINMARWANIDPSRIILG